MLCTVGGWRNRETQGDWNRKKMLGDHAKSPFGVVPDALNGCTHRVGVIPRFLPFRPSPSLCHPFIRPFSSNVLASLSFWFVSCAGCLNFCLFSYFLYLSPFASLLVLFSLSLPLSQLGFSHFPSFLHSSVATHSLARLLPSILSLFPLSVTFTASLYLSRSASSCQRDSLSNFLITPAEQRWPNQRVSWNKRRVISSFAWRIRVPGISGTLWYASVRAVIQNCGENVDEILGHWIRVRVNPYNNRFIS